MKPTDKTEPQNRSKTGGNWLLLFHNAEFLKRNLGQISLRNFGQNYVRNSGRISLRNFGQNYVIHKIPKNFANSCAAASLSLNSINHLTNLTKNYGAVTPFSVFIYKTDG